MKTRGITIINDDDSLTYAWNVAEKLLGKGKAVALPYPSLGGEDFSYYLLKVPGCFVRFGGAKDGHEKIASHSPKFDFDEEVLRVVPPGVWLHLVEQDVGVDRPAPDPPPGIL